MLNIADFLSCPTYQDISGFNAGRCRWCRCADILEAHTFFCVAIVRYRAEADTEPALAGGEFDFDLFLGAAANDLQLDFSLGSGLKGLLQVGYGFYPGFSKGDDYIADLEAALFGNRVLDDFADLDTRALVLGSDDNAQHGAVGVGRCRSGGALGERRPPLICSELER